MPPNAVPIESDDDESLPPNFGSSNAPADSASPELEGRAAKKHRAAEAPNSLSEATAALLANGSPSYNDTLVCVAPGLHVSKFPLDFEETHGRLRRLKDGDLQKHHVMARVWRGIHLATLEGALLVCDAIMGGCSPEELEIKVEVPPCPPLAPLAPVPDPLVPPAPTATG